MLSAKLPTGHAWCPRPHQGHVQGAEATVRQLDTVLAELAKRKAAVENVRKLGESAQQSRDKLNGPRRNRCCAW